MLNVHLRINDSTTKRPTPVRLRVSDESGRYYPPLGRLAVFAVGRAEDVGGHLRHQRENWCFVDGSCEVPLPSGIPLRIQVTKGPEYTPIDETMTLGAGQLSVRLEITRWHEPTAHSIDARAHFVSPHAALLEAAAEGVEVVQLLAQAHSFVGQDGNGYPSLTNLLAFSGQESALKSPVESVFVNTLNAHGALGRLALLNCHRVVHPLAFGSPDGPDDWSLADWCRQCHRKDGLVVWVDAFRTDRGILGGEALALALTGEVDAIEFDAQPRTQPLLPWVYKLWDAGVQIPLVGSSGKDSNRVAIGAMRTRIPGTVPGDTTNLRFLNAVRTRQTGITNGPLLTFDVTCDRLQAGAQSIVPFERLEIVANGAVIATVPARREGSRFLADLDIDNPKVSGWVAARAVGPKGSLLVPDQVVFAHTSAVFVGEPVRSASAQTALRQCLTATREWVETQGVFTAEKFKTHILETLAAGESRLES